MTVLENVQKIIRKHLGENLRHASQVALYEEGLYEIVTEKKLLELEQKAVEVLQVKGEWLNIKHFDLVDVVKNCIGLVY